ncbi:hemolysin III family protein [Pikeienuella piscinae]|uniref:Hemolysin III family protein n=1 Tax=Pikeienuella piscinae TaxID=2748098 RepID=A0A7M3T5L9_9RHOB|nr:hemolysin III family protein [Pikeienuella piscinae]QIE57300.1 hemolysin III family protein [Pikeienuella piscinae]
MRPQTRKEIAADAVVHGLGVGFGLIGGPILIGYVAARGDSGSLIAVSIYVATLIAMFLLSATYNLIPLEGAKDWLRRLDHSTIYLKIAGAYTPFAALSVGGLVGNLLLTGVWLAACVGIFLKMIYPRRFEALSIVLYLMMGWAAVVVAGDVAASIDAETMSLILIAGGLYSTGVFFHLWERLPFQNAIWHVFVLAATVVLYGAVALEFA